MSDERRPSGPGKRNFGGGAKRGFGGGKKFGSGPRGRSDFERGPKREYNDRPKRDYGTGPKREFSGDAKRESSGEVKREWSGSPQRDFRGPKREWSDRPKRNWGDRRPDGESFGDRSPRKRPFGDREKGFGGGRPKQNSRYRGMYNGPETNEDREKRQFRSGGPRPNEMARDQGDGSSRPHLAENELRYHGKNACLALLKNRPQDIVRAYVHNEKSEEFAPLIEFCAKNHKAYHLVDLPDLERLTDSIHHQGVCVVARTKHFFKEEVFFHELGAHRTLVIYLDGVANPHNLGAILRTAAHFGVKWICVPKDEITKISPALYRTAEGGAEIVNLVRVEDTEKFLDRLRGGGFQLYAFEPGAKAIPLFETRLNEKSVFVFGAEVEGLSGLVKSIVETKVTIPGTGSIESLNVSVAAAVAMAEFERQGQAPRSVRIVKSKS